MGLFDRFRNKESYYYDGDYGTWELNKDDKSQFKNPIKEYKNNFALQSVVNLRASYLAKGVFKVLDANGEIVENHPLLDVFASPNELTNENNFMKKYFF